MLLSKYELELVCTFNTAAIVCAVFQNVEIVEIVGDDATICAKLFDVEQELAEMIISSILNFVRVLDKIEKL